MVIFDWEENDEPIGTCFAILDFSAIKFFTIAFELFRSSRSRDMEIIRITSPIQSTVWFNNDDIMLIGILFVF